jgi:sterol 3beta-glucosyltransferase
MRVTLVGVGSRGDVQPYVALGMGLRAAGHEVRVAAQRDLRDRVEGRGLAFAPIHYDPALLLGSEEGISWVESGRNPAAFLWRMVTALRPIALRVAEDVLAAISDADVVVGSTLALSAYHAAEARRVPYIGAFLQPLHMTRAFPAVVFPRDDLGPWGNRLSGRVGALALELPFRAQHNRWRRQRLGLPPVRDVDFVARLAREQVPVLYGFSRWLVPKPSDWPASVRLCGYWTLPADRGWEPDPRLAAFLADGPPPVFVGFGSMRPRDPRRTSAAVVDALRRAGRRGVVAAGWAGLEATGDDVLVVDEVPHDWLFPRCAAVVHHGGAGTTGTALRAGVPSFAVPFFADQFFWGVRTARLGVGPGPIPARRLDPARLGAAIRTAVDDPGMRAAAVAAAARLAREDGIGTAVDAIASAVDQSSRGMLKRRR